MASALRRAGLPVAIQSERDVKGDSPAYAWLTALLTIMTDPLNAYEIVGVLREIFGALRSRPGRFSEAQKARFRIDEVQSAAGKISSQLRTLAEIRQRAQGLALFDAVALIVDQTHLRERAPLPATEFGDLGRELDALLAQAAEAEANGMISRSSRSICATILLHRAPFVSPRTTTPFSSSHRTKPRARNGRR